MKDINTYQIPTYVFDIDGTLANNIQREHYVTRPVGKKDWKSFYAEQYLDTVHEHVATILRSLAQDHYHIVLLTGRCASTRVATELWLDKNHIYYEELIMRPEDAREDDTTLKAKQLFDRFGKDATTRVAAIFEDRNRVVRGLRDAGFTVFHVADGDF